MAPNYFVTVFLRLTISRGFFFLLIGVQIMRFKGVCGQHKLLRVSQAYQCFLTFKVAVMLIKSSKKVRVLINQH